MITPCKDCTDRNVTCHGSCEKYQTYYAANMKRLDERQKAVARYCDIERERSDSIRKMARRKRA